jgi:ubiquitin C-terminal hydrolase
MYLSLPIPEKNKNGVKGGAVYIEDCLNMFVEIEILDGDDKWYVNQAFNVPGIVHAVNV